MLVIAFNPIEKRCNIVYLRGERCRADVRLMGVKPGPEGELFAMKANEAGPPSLT
jgi:hypothetical protein